MFSGGECTLKLICCIDNHGGMMFNHRRQSQDREVRRDILSYVGSGVLWMNAYSFKQFCSEHSDTQYYQIHVAENFISKAGPDDYCFVENAIYLINELDLSEIVLYHWNRDYPSDVSFDLNLCNWHIIHSKDFCGFSHEKITRKVFKKNEI